MIDFLTQFSVAVLIALRVSLLMLLEMMQVASAAEQIFFIGKKLIVLVLLDRVCSSNVNN